MLLLVSEFGFWSEHESCVLLACQVLDFVDCGSKESLFELGFVDIAINSEVGNN